MKAFYITAAVLGAMLLLYLVLTLIAAYIVYRKTLMRTDKRQWSRDAVSTPTPELLKMDAIGQEWHKRFLSYKIDVTVTRRGKKLCGEYYDFGNAKAVIILSGRTESLRYGYYFAQPYYEAGYNVLVIDPRAHGLSDGRYNTVGFEESKDALEWARLLHTRYGINHIVLHGICIGAAGGMFAVNSKDCPDYIKALVAEGMFTRFAENMRNNLIERKKNIFPILQAINFFMLVCTHHSMFRGPVNIMPRMTKPLLMLHSREDRYSVPQNAQKLYDMCKSENKQLVWFEHGAHSMLRITDTARYDSAIKQFLSGIS